MQKYILAFIAIFAGYHSATAREVERDGVQITVPDGEWKRWSGTCTGDTGWQREGIVFSIGQRRYLKRDDEWKSTGDIYTIYSFGDIKAAVISIWEDSSTHLVKEKIEKTDAGTDVLVLEFEIGAGKESPVRKRALLAFRETPDHRSAVEIRCSFVGEQDALGEAIFGAALKRLCVEKKEPNKALVPTVMSVTPAADAPVAPATTAAHL